MGRYVGLYQLVWTNGKCEKSQEERLVFRRMRAANDLLLAGTGRAPQRNHGADGMRDTRSA
jgi:hypothetical protein